MGPRFRVVNGTAVAVSANSGDSRKDRLGLLHVALKELAAEIDDVPERYETTGKGSLADMDAEVLRLATSVVHRLLQWELFPLNSPESYFKASE